ncbi:MAG: extracellular catalytic domain type 1 short-chain-length polyhydroxyalkanoate depolymerase [Hoeflea sp.]|uniref:extracellular catalytic domain type 1 short-chain-length polyhydroxyalkanoate depolymerase n=1 Tax=Hoeflea sp. TaxID=1940281 RepID=UPI003EF959AB
MTIFNASALRQAMASARLGHFEPARLVQQTLSRHGLSADASAEVPYAPRTAGSGLGDIFGSSLRSSQSRSGSARSETRSRSDVPASAALARHTFSCSAGSRDFQLFVPASAKGAPTALIVMLHGCTQTPEDFAAGTAMNALAEAHGFIVAYPAQSRGANQQTCWNWFSRGDQKRDRGEPAIIAGLTLQICEAHSIPATRTFVAGLSAGGAMAVIMGEAYPELYSGVGVHSGLPYGAARDVSSAFSAMGGKPLPSAMQQQARPPRTIVFHGSSDSTVHPLNGDMVAHNAEPSGPSAQLQRIENGTFAGRSFEKRITLGANGQSSVEHWIIDGLGHAWSGGNPAGSYTDPSGPDASTAMVRFFLAL